MSTQSSKNHLVIARRSPAGQAVTIAGLQFSNLRHALLHIYAVPECGEAVDRLLDVFDSLSQATAAVRQLRIEECELRSRPRCCGSEYWPQAKPHYGNYLFANHGTNEDCPLHGRHEKPGKRLRKGIGRDLDEQASVQQAMANWDKWQDTIARLREAESRLSRLQQGIDSLWHNRSGRYAPY